MNDKTSNAPQNNAGIPLGEGAASTKALCEKVLKLISLVEALCKKNETQITNQELLCEKVIDAIAEISNLCSKIEANTEEIQALCKKLLEVIGNQEQVLQCLEKIKEQLNILPAALDDFKIVKEPTGALVGADYTAALCYIDGRPNASAPWAWIDNTDPDNQVTIAEGSNLNEFTGAVEALGYTEWSFGEQHYICPVPANFAGPGSHFFTVDGETASKPDATPISEIEGAPAKVVENGEAFCALRTMDCGNDKRDDLLQQIVDKLCSIDKKLDCPECPELIVGAAEFTTEPMGPVAFPLTSPVNETADFAVPIALPEAECFDNPDQPIVVRWCFDHEIEASTNHTGFNVSGNDGTAQVGTIVGQSATGTTNVGPGSTPHDGPRDKYWVDIEFTVAQLQAGVALQTSAFGTITEEKETIYSQDISIQTDLAALGCC